MWEELRNIESQLEMHDTQTVITLAGLLQSNTHTELTEISTKVDTLDRFNQQFWCVDKRRDNTSGHLQLVLMRKRLFTDFL